MAKRVLTGAIGIIYIITIIFLNDIAPWLLNISIAVVCFLCSYELINAISLTKSYNITLPCYLLSAILPFVIQNKGLLTIVLFMYILYMFISIINKYGKVFFKDIILCYTLTILTSLGLVCIISLRNFGKENGIYFLLIPLVVAWCSDSAAFFVGRAFGKHKLSKRISPTKTVEGAVGGIIFSIIGMLVLTLCFKLGSFSSTIKINCFYCILISLIGSIIAILGDLVFSVIKRSCKIKDFSNIMPGHGGFLDRFDSVIFVSPFIYVFVMYLPLLSS